ncbi:237_t:CDS:2, partial [Paraglomus brasilianum]
MKYAKQLSLRTIPGWSEHYIDYRKLKKYLKDAFAERENASRSDTENDQIMLNEAVDKFRKMLVIELEKVNRHYEKIEVEASASLGELNSRWHKGLSQEEQDQWRKDMTELLQTLEYLHEFANTNITGFQKILKKFDRTFYKTSTTSERDEISQQVQSNLRTTLHSEPEIVITNASGLYNLTCIPSRTSTASPSSNLNRYSFTPIGKDLWALVTTYSFVTSERDEALLSRGRQIWRKHVPLSPAATPSLQDLSSLNVEDASIPTMTSLDLDVLPNGIISLLWVILAEDGLGLPLKAPVMVAKGVKPGPVVGLTAALHGNELNGIPLIHRLMSQELDCTALHGIVVAVPVANIPGYLASQRTFSDGTDLNRVMPGKRNGTTSQVYAFNLIDRIVSKMDYLLDLHTASKGRANSLYVRANMVHEETRWMARLQNPQIIVHNTSPDGSLRGAAMERGIPAITVEIGDPSKFQKRFVRNALQG